MDTWEKLGALGLAVVAVVALWKKSNAQEERYALLVAQVATALELTPAQLSEIKGLAYEIRDGIKALVAKGGPAE